jgi:hypothetical protein
MAIQFVKNATVLVKNMCYCHCLSEWTNPHNLCMNTKDNAVCVHRSREYAWWELERGQLLSLDGARGLCLRCLYGKAWVTQAGDEEDYLLEASDPLALDRRGRIVIEALSSCRLTIGD